MGLNNRESGTYLTIYQGKFSQRVGADAEGAVSRVNKLDKVVFEKYYDSFTGRLADVKVTDSDYGKSWNFYFIDGEDKYIIQLSYSNSYATALLKMLPNIDLSKEMTLSPSTKVVEGKNQTSLFIKQDGVNIKHAHTKDNPNGMPEMEQIVVKGQPVWDDSKRLVFLNDMVESKILPQLHSLEMPDGNSEVMEMPIDDLSAQPF